MKSKILKAKLSVYKAKSGKVKYKKERSIFHVIAVILIVLLYGKIRLEKERKVHVKMTKFKWLYYMPVNF